MFVLDSRISSGGRETAGVGQSAPSLGPAPPSSSGGRLQDPGEGSGGADVWDGGQVLEGALRAIGWPSTPQVSSLERAVQEAILEQYTL